MRLYVGVTLMGLSILVGFFAAFEVPSGSAMAPFVLIIVGLYVPGMLLTGHYFRHRNRLTPRQYIHELRVRNNSRI